MKFPIGSRLTPAKLSRYRNGIFFGTLTVTADRKMVRNVVGRIVIAGDDLTLDCDGHTITAAAKGGSCGTQNDDCGIIVEGRRDVTLTNCKVIGHGTGMWISTSDNIDVRYSYAAENIVGFQVDDSDSVTFYQNTASTNEDMGFAIRDSSYTFLWLNTSLANGRDGFDENDGVHSYYLRNTAINNVVNGFELDFSEDANLSENNAYTNGQHGISLDAVDGGLIHDNYILGCGEDGLRLEDDSNVGTVNFEVSDNHSTGNGDEAAQQCPSLCTGNVYINNVFQGPTNNIP